MYRNEYDFVAPQWWHQKMLLVEVLGAPRHDYKDVQGSKIMSSQISDISRFKQLTADYYYS